MLPISGKAFKKECRMQTPEVQQKRGELKRKNITLLPDYLKSPQIREPISQVDENKIPGEE